MKVRGDGRAYVINLGYDGFFDFNWYSLYSYFLFTRGGPYWQIAKVNILDNLILNSQVTNHIHEHRIP